MPHSSSPPRTSCRACGRSAAAVAGDFILTKPDGKRCFFHWHMYCLFDVTAQEKKGNFASFIGTEPKLEMWWCLCSSEDLELIRS